MSILRKHYIREQQILFLINNGWISTLSSLDMWISLLEYILKMTYILQIDINRIPAVVPVAQNQISVAGHLYVKRKHVCCVNHLPKRI